MENDAARMRRDYSMKALDEADVLPDPIAQFGRWFDEARGSGLLEPNAMALATVGADGQPSNRTVLLKGFDRDGFVFYTNRQSRKGTELAATPKASLLFWWDRLERQVRIDGVVETVDAADSDAYFASRPQAARIGAWASPQSRRIESRAWLEAEVTSLAERFGESGVPRPEHWGGYRVVPHAIEFWQGRSSRLHDRLIYRREGVVWTLARLAP